MPPLSDGIYILDDAFTLHPECACAGRFGWGVCVGESVSCGDAVTFQFKSYCYVCSECRTPYRLVVDLERVAVIRDVAE